MFNGNTSGYSLADIAAATGGNDRNNGWGEDCWWIVLFILILAGGNNWGNGLFGGRDATSSGITDGYILTTDFANIERKIDGVNNGICDGFYAMNTGMLNGFNSLGNAIQGAQADVTAAINADTIANMQNTNAISNQLTGIGTQIAQCCCDQKSTVLQQTNQLQASIANLMNVMNQGFTQVGFLTQQQTNELNNNANANTQRILDKMCADTTQELRDKLAEASQNAQTSYLISQLKTTATT